MAFKRLYLRAQFDSSLSTSQKEAAVDELFDRWETVGLDGLIVGRGEDAIFILEGDDTDVNHEAGFIKSSSNFVHEEEIFSETSGSSSGTLFSHIDSDARESDP
jgi:hypothetical protein